MKSIDKLAFFDLDNTLIDKDYQITDPDIFDLVKQAQINDWQIGLNSDTPYTALTLWRERFGMNGPIIAERGAVIELEGKPVSSTEDAYAVDKSKSDIVRRSRELGFSVWLGNPVEEFRSGKQPEMQGSVGILLNELSQSSLRFFVRAINSNGKMSIDRRVTDMAMRSFEDVFPQFSDPLLDVDHAFGFVNISRASTSKRLGTLAVLRNMKITRCLMVGDSYADFIGNDIADHYAVNNAEVKLKNNAQFVAKGRVTTGACQILRKLIKE